MSTLHLRVRFGLDTPNRLGIIVPDTLKPFVFPVELDSAAFDSVLFFLNLLENLFASALKRGFRF